VTEPLRPGLLAELRRRATIYRTFTAIPDNAGVSLMAALGPHIGDIPERVPALRERFRRRRLVRFEDDLRLLNDVLQRTALSGRYWIWAGLLGWAREGKVLRHDIGDADFAVDADDAELLEAAEPLLLEAGFRRWFCFRDCDGELTQRTYTRHGSKFDFFLMREVAAGVHQCHVYTPRDDGPFELVSRIPKQELEPFEFLDRAWLKPRDHDLSLRSCYGTWRVPDPDWDADANPSVVLRRPWIPPVPVPPRRATAHRKRVRGGAG
jgi:hypothetical protein